MEIAIVILAGGKGTRIKSVLGDIPKILAPIEGKPFLSWMLDWISSWSLEFESNIIISTGIGHKKVNKYCLENKPSVKCIPEEKPLGTFGALANIASTIDSKHYLVLNGDTIFEVNMNSSIREYIKSNNEPHIFLKQTIKKL